VSAEQSDVSIRRALVKLPGSFCMAVKDVSQSDSLLQLPESGWIMLMLKPFKNAEALARVLAAVMSKESFILKKILIMVKSFENRI
jgi:hypothetical protein